MSKSRIILLSIIMAVPCGILASEGWLIFRKWAYRPIGNEDEVARYIGLTKEGVNRYYKPIHSVHNLQEAQRDSNSDGMPDEWEVVAERPEFGVRMINLDHDADGRRESSYVQAFSETATGAVVFRESGTESIHRVELSIQPHRGENQDCLFGYTDINSDGRIDLLWRKEALAPWDSADSDKKSSYQTVYRAILANDRIMEIDLHMPYSDTICTVISDGLTFEALFEGGTWVIDPLSD